MAATDIIITTQTDSEGRTRYVVECIEHGVISIAFARLYQADDARLSHRRAEHSREVTHRAEGDALQACSCGVRFHLVQPECSGPCVEGRNCVHCQIGMRRERAEARSEALYASSYGLGL